jgi:hypothetical protein
MENFAYTRAERRTIDAAYNAVAYLLDHTSSGAHTLADAYRHERRERRCATIAKALIVRGFMHGRKKNPRADELAYTSRGIVLATLMGADTRRREWRGDAADTLRKLPRLAAAAAAAHDEYLRRGCDRAARSL